MHKVSLCSKCTHDIVLFYFQSKDTISTCNDSIQVPGTDNKNKIKKPFDILLINKHVQMCTLMYVPNDVFFTLLQLIIRDSCQYY